MLSLLVDCREDPINFVPGVEEIKRQDMMSYLQETNTSSMSHQIIFKAFDDVKAADFVLCNTVEELEPKIIAALQAKKLFYAIGPIFPSGFTQSSVPTSLWPESDCTHWLNTKPPRSVLYVSFGSYAHVTNRDLMEIASGLLLSKVDFVWVLRPDIVSSDYANPLPVGFGEEAGDRLMIVPWCSQIKVLSHPAIGGFLSHCGWNSVLESIWNEVPLLCFPLLTDQFTNRKLVVDDWKMGINLCDKDSIVREEVSSNINRVMIGKSRDELRNRVKEVKRRLEDALTPEGSSENNMNKFVEDLMVKIKYQKVLLT